MVRVTAYIRPHRLEQVKSAIAALGLSGLNVTDVRGAGASEQRSSLLRGTPQVIALPIRSRLEIVAPDDRLEELIVAICDNARTGEPGDGKLFVERVTDVLRIRTGERGELAL